MAAAKKKTYAQIKAEMAKKYDLRIGSLNSVIEDVEVVPSGNMALDHVLGVGGFPRGRSVELYGQPSSGKTTCGLMLAASVQRKIIAGEEGYAGKVIMYMDHEHAVDLEYARSLGLDPDHESFEFAQPDSFEQSANVALGLIETGMVCLIIFDSVAAMVAEAALEAEVGKSLPAIQARLMSDFLKKLNGMAARTKTIVIFLNHIMEVMEMGGKPGYKKWSTPGGRALKFYASIRIEFQQIKNLKGSYVDELTKETVEQVNATDVRIQVVKNKVAPPFKRAVVRVRFGKGFDDAYNALKILIGHKKIIVGAGGYFFFHHLPALTDGMAVMSSGTHRPYIRGEATLFDRLDSDPVWRDQFIAEAQAVLRQAPDAVEEPISEEDMADLASEGIDVEEQEEVLSI